MSHEDRKADDELLALAAEIIAQREGGAAKYRDDQLQLWFLKAVTISRAVIALIERHRAEMERLTRERDAWEFTARANGAGAAAAERERDEARANIEQLTAIPERDRIAAAATARDCDIALFPATIEDATRVIAQGLADLRAELQTKIDAAESALAAAQKRIAELEDTLAYIAARQDGVSSGTPLDQLVQVRETARAALAGKEPGNDQG